MRLLLLLSSIAALFFIAVTLTLVPLPSTTAKDYVKVLDKAPYVTGDLTLCLPVDNKEKYVATLQIVGKNILLKSTARNSLALIVEIKACTIDGKCRSFLNMGVLEPGTYKLYARASALPGEVCISFMPVS